MPTLNDLADLATVATAIISLAAAIIAFVSIRSVYRQTKMQIVNNGLENRKWKTLEVCAQYELNDNITNSARNVFTAFAKGEPEEGVCKAITRDVIVILNYLDGIAIGVGQGLYIEELARDHLKNIVQYHVSHLLDPSLKLKFKDIDQNNYSFLIDMNTKWARSQTYFNAG